MTPQTIITEVRKLIQDAAGDRFSDSDLVGFVNQAIKRMVSLRPDLFVTSAAVETTDDVVEQSLPTSAVRLLEIFSVVGGSAVTEVDRETMDQMYPEWVTEASGTPVNWIRHPRKPTGYFLYPRPSASVQLNTQYVDTPSDYTLSATITGLPESYFTAIIDCVVFLAESVDAESVGNDRAKFYYDNFLEALGIDQNQRAVVDAESGLVGTQQQRRRSQQNGNS